VYVGSSQFTTTAFTLVNSGTAVQGAGVIPVTKTSSVINSYNLIANPYASPISFTALRAQGTNATKIANAMYGWNANLNGGNGGHVQFVNGISNPGGITGMNDVIPMGQGFFVEALSSGNLDYNESI